MKKRLIVTGFVAGALAAAAAMTAVAAEISGDRAMEIALQHAEVSEEKVLFSKVEKDWDDGRMSYEVEFLTEEGKEYDYEIAAADGRVLSYDYDAEAYGDRDRERNRKQDRKDRGAVSVAKEDLLSRDEARKKILDHAKLSADDVEFVMIESDWDDGRAVYEGKFYYDRMEYEFEMDASTGKILEFDVESIYD